MVFYTDGQAISDYNHTGPKCSSPGPYRTDAMHCKKRLLFLPSPSGMSLTKLVGFGHARALRASVLFRLIKKQNWALRAPPPPPS